MRSVLEDALLHRDWRDLVNATASANYVEDDLPGDWETTWNKPHSVEWLLGFDFIGDGSDLEIRRFETSFG